MCIRIFNEDSDTIFELFKENFITFKTVLYCLFVLENVDRYTCKEYFFTRKKPKAELKDFWGKVDYMRILKDGIISFLHNCKFAIGGKNPILWAIENGFVGEEEKELKNKIKDRVERSKRELKAELNDYYPEVDAEGVKKWFESAAPSKTLVIPEIDDLHLNEGDVDIDILGC